MNRLTPRQAVVIVARHAADLRLASLAGDLGPDRLDALLLATLRDAIAAAVRVDGVSIAVVAPSQAALLYLRQVLPAGLDLMAAPGAVPVGMEGRFAIAQHEGSGFERILVIDGAVLRLTSRVVGTGLGALAHADIVTGGYRNGSSYVFGLLTRHIPAIIASDLVLGNAHRPEGDLRGHLRGLRLCSRRLDPLPTLDAFATLDELRTALHGRPGVGKNVTAFLGAAPSPGVHESEPSHLR